MLETKLVKSRLGILLLMMFVIRYICAQEQTPQFFNECGGSLELDPGATYGILTNPDYPSEANRESRYPNDANCLWTLDGDEETLMQVKIWDLAIEPGEDNSNITCDYDYLNITIESMGSRVLCGAYPPMDIIRGMGRLTIRFVSDDSVNYRGFQATFQKVPNYNPCRKNNPCQSGTCEFDVKNLTTVCICPPGAQGKLCDVDVKECESQPCLNGGECKDDGPINTYECTCQPGWKGVNCEEEQGSFCSPNPCKFGGTCKEEDKTSYECECKEGYDGEHCEEVVGCGNPGIPGIDEQRRFNYGTSLSYSCEGDFALKGKENSTCLDDGTWSNIMPKCEDHFSNASSISPYMLTMVALGGLLAINLVAFVAWMVHHQPWNISRHNVDGNFTPSMDSQHRSYSSHKSIYSITPSQLTDSYISDIA